MVIHDDDFARHCYISTAPLPLLFATLPPRQVGRIDCGVRDDDFYGYTALRFDNAHIYTPHRCFRLLANAILLGQPPTIAALSLLCILLSR